MPRFVCGAQSEIDQIIAWSAAGIERVVNHGVFAMTRPRIRKDEFNGPALSRPNGSLEKSHETNELITIFATMVKRDKSNIGCVSLQISAFRFLPLSAFIKAVEQLKN